MRYLIITLCIALAACGGGKTEKLLQHKQWKVYNVTVPKGDPYNNGQITQANDLKDGYYSDAHYQFLDNNVFIATIAGKPDTGRYKFLSNGRIISITSVNGSRTSEHLVEVVKLSEKSFDMKVASGDYHFVLHTRPQ